MKKNLKIILTGEGGQGIQTIGKILFNALSKSEKNISIIPQFGPEQRGTPSVVFIQLSDDKINYPRFETADAILIMRKRAYQQIAPFIGKDTLIVFDSSTIPRKIISQNSSKVFGAPITRIAKVQFSDYGHNIIALALFSKFYLALSKNILWLAIEEVLKKKFVKNPKQKILAKSALDFSYDLKIEEHNFSRAEFDVDNDIIIKKNSERLATTIPALCKSCGICILKCPVRAISWGDTIGVFGKPTPKVDLQKCIACGNCFRFCPDSAIRVEKR